MVHTILDPDVVDSLEKKAEALVSVFGFRPTMSQVIRHLSNRDVLFPDAKELQRRLAILETSVGEIQQYINNNEAAAKAFVENRGTRRLRDR